MTIPGNFSLLVSFFVVFFLNTKGGRGLLLLMVSMAVWARLTPEGSMWRVVPGGVHPCPWCAKAGNWAGWCGGYGPAGPGWLDGWNGSLDPHMESLIRIIGLDVAVVVVASSALDNFQDPLELSLQGIAFIVPEIELADFSVPWCLAIKLTELTAAKDVDAKQHVVFIAN